MLRSLWFLIRLAALILLIGWLATREGVLNIDAYGYQVEAHMGLVLVALFFALLILWGVVSAVRLVLSLPKAASRRYALKQQDKGMESIMIGLSAMAAGDSASLRKASKATAHLAANDHGLGLFMRAMADRMDGNDNRANDAFNQLMDHRGGSFLAVKALYQKAVRDGRDDQALALARQAHTLHPNQGWVVRMRYDQETRNRHWAEAEPLLKKMVRLKLLTGTQAADERAAMILAQSDDLASVRSALKKQPGHLPATLLWIEHLLAQGKGAQAAKTVEKTWKTHPHPDLADFWIQAMPKSSRRNQKSRTAWINRLVKKNSEAPESQILLARFLMDEKLYDKAEETLNTLLTTREGAKARAKLAELRDEGEAQIKHWLEAAADSTQGKIWVCRETGLTYDRWSPFAGPHNSFNSMIWDHPSQASKAYQPPYLALAQDFLISAA